MMVLAFKLNVVYFPRLNSQEQLLSGQTQSLFEDANHLLELSSIVYKETEELLIIAFKELFQ